jgi:hypothetical protein
MEMWVVGVMGGGSTAPVSDYNALQDRVAALEASTANDSGPVAIGAIGYTFIVNTSSRYIKSAGGNIQGYSAGTPTPVISSLPALVFPTGVEPVNGTVGTNSLGQKYMTVITIDGSSATSNGFGTTFGTRTGIAIRIE